MKKEKNMLQLCQSSLPMHQLKNSNNRNYKILGVNIVYIFISQKKNY